VSLSVVFSTCARSGAAFLPFTEKDARSEGPGGASACSQLEVFKALPINPKRKGFATQWFSAKLLLKSFRINGSRAWVSSASCWAISGGRYLQPSWKLLSRFQDCGRLKRVSIDASTTSVGSHLSPCCNPTCSTQDSVGPPCFILASLYTVNHRSIPGPPKWPEFDSTFESFPDVDCSARSIDPVVTGSD